MRKKFFYVVFFGIITVFLSIIAGHYLEMQLKAAPGDICTCGCDDDALNACDYMCRYHEGCLGIMNWFSRCDTSNTACNNTYTLTCEDGLKRDFVCSEECVTCDETFWQ